MSTPFHEVVYLYLVAGSPLPHEKVLGEGGTHVSCQFILVFVCHKWCTCNTVLILFLTRYVKLEIKEMLVGFLNSWEIKV